MFRATEPDSTSQWCFWIFCICSNLITKQSLYFFITGKNRVGVSSTFNDIITSNESLSTIKGREGSHYQAASRSAYSLAAVYLCSCCGWWLAVVSVRGLDEWSAMPLSHGQQLLLCLQFTPTHPFYTHFLATFSTFSHSGWQKSKGYGQFRSFFFSWGEEIVKV